jgi:hypothetical protein
MAPLAAEDAKAPFCLAYSDNTGRHRIFSTATRSTADVNAKENVKKKLTSHLVQLQVINVL